FFALLGHRRSPSRSGAALAGGWRGWSALPDLLQERAESVLTQPKLHHVGDPAAGDGRARQRVDLVLTGRVLGDGDRRHRVARLEGPLALPRALPVGVVDLAAEPGGLGVLVVGDARDGLAVGLEREVAEQEAPQPVALDRQD